MRRDGVTRLSAVCCLLSALFVLSLSAQQQTTPDYVVGPQDVLSITVWDQTDLSGKYTVEADGTITFPLIGRVKAAGLTLKQIDGELKKRLSDGYFKNPQLSVSVETYRSQRVFIVGEVRTPGTYTLTGDMSLIEALSRAGSTTPTASPEAVIVRAADGAAPTGPTLPSQASAGSVVRVDLKDLQSGTSKQNVALKDGDTIFVPKAETVFVFGQVKNPGAYPLQAKETTVMQALSLAGGVTDRGSTSRVKVIRVVDGVKKELKVKLTDLVQAGDTLVVPERYF
jgi:polysaccharide biosynthesis/export protein